MAPPAASRGCTASTTGPATPATAAARRSSASCSAADRRIFVPSASRPITSTGDRCRAAVPALDTAPPGPSTRTRLPGKQGKTGGSPAPPFHWTSRGDPPNHGGSVLSALRQSSLAGVCLGLVVAIAGCGGGSKDGGAHGTSADAQQPAAKPGRLSYGTVTSTVKKNQTTQAELLDMFGGPNISTTDASGLETWVYERSASDTDTSASNDA